MRGKTAAAFDRGTQSPHQEYPGHGAIDRQPDGANTCPSEGFRRQLRRPYRIAGAGAWTIDSKFLAKRGYHASGTRPNSAGRSEERTSELQSLMRISYAVFCLKKKTNKHTKFDSVT